MRKSVMIVILIASLSFPMSYFMGFDTRSGVSLGVDMDGVRLYTGYRYSGVEARWSFKSMTLSYQMALDPFYVNFITDTEFGISTPILGLHLMGKLIVSPSTEASQTGLLILGTVANLNLGNLTMRLEMGTVPVVMLYYSKENTMDFYYFFPPSDIEDIVMNSRLDFSMGMSYEGFRVRLGYTVNYGFLKGVPTPLLNLNGVYLKIFMEKRIQGFQP